MPRAQTEQARQAGLNLFLILIPKFIDSQFPSLAHTVNLRKIVSKKQSQILDQITRSEVRGR